MTVDDLAMEVTAAKRLMSTVRNRCKEIPYKHIWVPLVALPTSAHVG
jgi:hypothetical protein